MKRYIPITIDFILLIGYYITIAGTNLFGLLERPFIHLLSPRMIGIYLPVFLMFLIPLAVVIYYFPRAHQKLPKITRNIIFAVAVLIFILQGTICMVGIGVNIHNF